MGERLAAEGKQPVTHVAGSEEYWQMLKQKLREEAAEYAAMEKEEELADVLEVIHAILDYKKLSLKQIEKIRLQKKKEKGGFTERIVWERNEM